MSISILFDAKDRRKGENRERDQNIGDKRTYIFVKNQSHLLLCEQDACASLEVLSMHTVVSKRSCSGKWDRSKLVAAASPRNLVAARS